MNELAIVIPTHGRASRIETIVRNLKETTQGTYTTYWMIEREDVESRRELERLGERYLFNVEPFTYVGAINEGYRRSVEPYIFCGADDLDFTPGWNVPVKEKLVYYGFVGVKDDWKITKTGFHASHFAVSRKYIQEQSGVEDEDNVIYSSRYRHYMCDIETEQTAMKRKTFIMAESVVHHNHWVNGTAVKDVTYTKEQRNYGADYETYCQRRKMFEQYLFEDLQLGIVTPTPKRTLSVVLASYNALGELKKTIESLYEQTYSEFELVIVDDCSRPEVQRYIRELQYANIKRIFHDRQKYVTEVWNTGMRYASGAYRCVINNDIRFSKNWDVYLMNALDEDDVYLANPYQYDAGETTAYGKHPRAGDIAIRGTCWMTSAKKWVEIGEIPKVYKIWCNDSWLAWRVKELGKRSVFVEKSVVFHVGSVSSNELGNETGVLEWIQRGDVYAHQVLTGERMGKWAELIERRIEKRNR